MKIAEIAVVIFLVHAVNACSAGDIIMMAVSVFLAAAMNRLACR